MYKRIVSFCLCLFLLLSLAVPVGAQEEGKKLTILNRKTFLRFAENCRLDIYSLGLTVVLETDLDLTDVDFDGIPIFGGTFEGKGHTICGLDLTSSGSAQGLFRYLTETAEVRNLNLEGQIHPEGSRSEIGGLAGRNAGRITNCVFQGTVSGNSSVGGLVGINEVSGVLEYCEVRGSVYGSHFVGGIAGENSGVIRNSKNNARINDTARQNSVDLTEITLESITGTESVNTVTDIGGIAGISNGVIRGCYNLGSVGYPHMGYNVGGIAGTQSGMVLDCENLAEIQGRKEVGGIVGQMEPTALIRYEEDALQILERQLSAMGSTISKTMSNLEGMTNNVVSQVGTLSGHVLNAQGALGTLIPDEENPELPDMDTIQAARNNISSSISGMTQTLQGINATAHGAMGTMSTNLHTLQRQIDAMRTTLGNVSETLGGSLLDVSDRDSEEDLSGKVANCTNRGSVLADRNAGGIAGAMALENDLDPEEDWDITGGNSLNFESEIRAVVRDCTNVGTVTLKKENGGGIVGWQSLGLVKHCVNSGALDAAGADHVGGISGQSTGFIRNSSAKCTITGTNQVGGIAGSADIVTDCRSLVKLDHTGERAGAILGSVEQNRKEEEIPVSGNLYFAPFRDLGGIDGISYAGQAQSMELEAFLELEELPEVFRTVTLTFQYPNGMERNFQVPLGKAFDTRWTPVLPPKRGVVATWEGMNEADLQEVLFDMTFTAHYSRQTSIIGSENVRGDHPILLLQGAFAEDASLLLEEAEAAAALERGETIVEAWKLYLSGANMVQTGRLRLPEGFNGDHCRILVQNADGVWNTAEHTLDGGSVVFGLSDCDQGVALVQTPETPWLWATIGGAAALVVLLVLVLGSRKRKK